MFFAFMFKLQTRELLSKAAKSYFVIAFFPARTQFIHAAVQPGLQQQDPLLKLLVVVCSNLFLDSCQDDRQVKQLHPQGGQRL